MKTRKDEFGNPKYFVFFLLILFFSAFITFILYILAVYLNDDKPPLLDILIGLLVNFFGSFVSFFIIYYLDRKSISLNNLNQDYITRIHTKLMIKNKFGFTITKADSLKNVLYNDISINLKYFSFDIETDQTFKDLIDNLEKGPKKRNVIRINPNLSLKVNEKNVNFNYELLTLARKEDVKTIISNNFLISETHLYLFFPKLKEMFKELFTYEHEKVNSREASDIKDYNKFSFSKDTYKYVFIIDLRDPKNDHIHKVFLDFIDNFQINS